MKAVSARSRCEIRARPSASGERLTMSAAQCTKVVGHTIQVVAVGRELRAGIVLGNIRSAAYARGKWSRHVVREVKALQGEVDTGLNLLRKVPFH